MLEKLPFRDRGSVSPRPNHAVNLVSARASIAPRLHTVPDELRGVLRPTSCEVGQDGAVTTSGPPSDERHRRPRANSPTTDIGGRLVPQAGFDEALVVSIFDRVNDMVDAVYRNLAELRQLVDRPMPAANYGVRPQSLREVDNSFRHGLRVFFIGPCPKSVSSEQSKWVRRGHSPRRRPPAAAKREHRLCHGGMLARPDDHPCRDHPSPLSAHGTSRSGLHGALRPQQPRPLTTAAFLSLAGPSDAEPPPA